MCAACDMHQCRIQSMQWIVSMQVGRGTSEPSRAHTNLWFTQNIYSPLHFRMRNKQLLHAFVLFDFCILCVCLVVCHNFAQISMHKLPGMTPIICTKSNSFEAFIAMFVQRHHLDVMQCTMIFNMKQQQQQIPCSYIRKY